MTPTIPTPPEARLFRLDQFDIVGIAAAHRAAADVAGVPWSCACGSCRIVRVAETGNAG